MALLVLGHRIAVGVIYRRTVLNCATVRNTTTKKNQVDLFCRNIVGDRIN